MAIDAFRRVGDGSLRMRPTAACFARARAELENVMRGMGDMACQVGRDWERPCRVLLFGPSLFDLVLFVQFSEGSGVGVANRLAVCLGDSGCAHPRDVRFAREEWVLAFLAFFGVVAKPCPE